MRTLENMLNRLKSYQYESSGIPSFMLYTSENEWVACFRNSMNLQPAKGKTPFEACKNLIVYLKTIDMWGIDIEEHHVGKILKLIDDRSTVYNCFSSEQLLKALEPCRTIKDICNVIYDIESGYMEQCLTGDVTDETIIEARDFLKNFQNNLPKIIKQALEER